MIIEGGDEVRAAERIARLIGQYAERFDPPGRAEFYGSVAGKITRMSEGEIAFLSGDAPVKKIVKSEGKQAKRHRA